MLTAEKSQAERPSGIAAVSGLLALAGIASLFLAVLVFLQAIPLSYGSVLLPGGLEQRGPVSFLLYSAFLLILGWALWTRHGWARRLTLLLAAIGVALDVPAVSSAVADGRLFAIAREGLQIMIRVAVIFYLTQPPVRDWYSAPRT